MTILRKSRLQAAFSFIEYTWSGIGLYEIGKITLGVWIFEIILGYWLEFVKVLLYLRSIWADWPMCRFVIVLFVIV